MKGKHRCWFVVVHRQHEEHGGRFIGKLMSGPHLTIKDARERAVELAELTRSMATVVTEGSAVQYTWGEVRARWQERWNEVTPDKRREIVTEHLEGVLGEQLIRHSDGAVFMIYWTGEGYYGGESVSNGEQVIHTLRRLPLVGEPGGPSLAELSRVIARQRNPHQHAVYQVTGAADDMHIWEVMRGVRS